MPPTAGPGYRVRRVSEAPTVPCPCGASTRVVTAADGLGCSLHVTAMTEAARHYHLETTEVYYILEGRGKMELGGETVEVEPGTVVTIEPGTPHRVVSRQGIRAIVFALPAFRADDEYCDG
jgi:mannose-6-phosphate isomerase-like protein (cupin superfamily)